MKPKEMFEIPVEKRRGAVSNNAAEYRHFIIQQDPDLILDALLAEKVIGAARRDCLTASLAGQVPRPIGSWGILIRLKGHPYTYFMGDKRKATWCKEWAAKFGWRICYFGSGQTAHYTASCYDGSKLLFDFQNRYRGEKPAGAAYREELDDYPATIQGESKVCTQAWLDEQANCGNAMDALARFADVYVPVCMHHSAKDGNAKPYGWDGHAHPEGDDELYQELPPSAYERIDVFTFGGPETLEPNRAALMLTAAVHRCDAAGAEAAIKEGANPNLMADANDSPLIVSLGHGSPYLPGGRFAKVSRQQLLDLLQVLLKAGAKPDTENASAIHKALHWANGGDEKTILDQLRLLLDHGADPNSPQSFIFNNGNRPLHVVARFDRWVAVMKLLVSRGADPLAKNNAGKTPRELAEESLNKSQGSDPTNLFKTITNLSGDKAGKEAGPLSQMFAKFKGAMSAESQLKTERLKAVVAFLESAERGEADLSDIDQIAAESTGQHEIQKQKEQADKQQQIIALQAKMKGLLKEAGAEKTVTSAEKMIEDNKKIFIERYEYRPATEADFVGRDRAWYDSTKDIMTLLGFRWLGDVVNETIAKTAGIVAIMRRFVSTDGTTTAVVYQVVRENKTKKTTTDLRICECESELSDGRFITTSNTAGANLVTMPKQIHATLLPANTSPKDLLTQHESNQALAMKQDPAIKFTVIQSMEDYTALQDRQSAIKAAFRKGIGYLDPAEIRRIAEQKFPDDPVKVALMTVGADTARRTEQLKNHG